MQGRYSTRLNYRPYKHCIFSLDNLSAFNYFLQLSRYCNTSIHKFVSTFKYAVDSSEHYVTSHKNIYERIHVDVYLFDNLANSTCK